MNKYLFINLVRAGGIKLLLQIWNNKVSGQLHIIPEEIFFKYEPKVKSARFWLFGVA